MFSCYSVHFYEIKSNYLNIVDLSHIYLYFERIYNLWGADMIIFSYHRQSHTICLDVCSIGFIFEKINIAI